MKTEDRNQIIAKLLNRKNPLTWLMQMCRRPSVGGNAACPQGSGQWSLYSKTDLAREGVQPRGSWACSSSFLLDNSPFLLCHPFSDPKNPQESLVSPTTVHSPQPFFFAPCEGLLGPHSSSPIKRRDRLPATILTVCSLSMNHFSDMLLWQQSGWGLLLVRKQQNPEHLLD